MPTLPSSRSRFYVYSSALIVCLTLCAAIALPLAVSSQTKVVSAQKALGRQIEATAEVPVTGTDELPPSQQAKIHVMVEMNEPPAAQLFAEALKVAQAEADAVRAFALANPRARGSQAALLEKPKAVQIDAAAAERVKTRVQTLDASQQALLPSLTAPNIDADVIYRVQRSFNGIAILVKPDKMDEISKMPGVKSVRRIQLKEKTASSSVNFIGTRSFWSKVVPGAIGLHGENIRVAVIDSGLDYIHTNFGGPGTTAAYASVTDTSFPNINFPSAKVPAGFDFAGDSYNASSNPDGSCVQCTPFPDQNPYDGNPSGNAASHGTAVASLVGGYGVNFGGATYFGNYDGVNPNIAGMKISPGIAPNARIIPLRVFGNSGSTALTTQAIDWAMDPNGDGDFSDRVDVINMSLGSNIGYPDDDSAVASSNAASAGVVVVASAGNAADTYYITGSPGVATGILSVAATFNDQAGFVFNARVRLNSPAALAGQDFFAIYGTGPVRAPAGGLTGDVVFARPADGSTPFTNAAFVAGKIALIDRGAVSFLQKVQNAQAAGATAVIMVNNVPGDPFTMGALETTTIPAVMISQADGNTLKTAAAFNPTTGVPANPTNVTINNDNGEVTRPGTSSDTLPSYSSRGPRPGDSAIKPDISAPAEVVSAAANRGGSAVRNFNGTSSAAPHVAGSMALMKQLHPDWSVQELNALAVSTATNDLFTTSPSASPSPAATPLTQIGIGRIGAGRIGLAKASQSNVVAYNGTDPGLLGVSFGVVDVPVDGSVALSKNIKVTNKGTSAVTYNVTYQEVTPVGGANFNFPTSNFTVAPGTSTNIPVSFAATGNALRHEREASVSGTQAVSGGTFARQWLTEKTGYAVLTPTGGPEPQIRVALYANPRPTSAMHATINGITPPASSGTFSVNLTGSGIDTGPLPFGGPPPGGDPFGILSLVKPLELQYVSSQAGSPTAPTDPNVIKYVGISTDYPNPAAVAPSPSPAPAPKSTTRVVFAIEGFGDASLPQFHSSDKEILIDTNRDGTDDFVIFFSSRANGTSRSNVYRPTVVNLATGAGSSLGFETNGFPSSVLDTNSFNNSVIMAMVNATSIGLIGSNGAGPTQFDYTVVTFDRNGDFVDSTPTMTYDLARPGFDVSGGFPEPSYYDDLPGVNIPVNYNGANYQANFSRGLLLLHMHNGPGNRSDVIAFRKPLIRNFSPTSGKVGAQITINGANFGPGTQVTFFNNQPASSVNVISSTTLVATVPPGAISGPIRVSNAAGFSSRGGFTVLPGGPGPSPSPTANPTASPTSRTSAIRRGN